MTAYTLQVPDPAPGTDWQVVVPGLKVYDVTGITAQFNTAGVGDLLSDVSGHGNDGTYLSPTPFGAFVPGLLTGLDAWQPNAPPAGQSFDAAIIPFALADWTANFTLAWWMRGDPSEIGGGGAWYEMGSPNIGAAGILLWAPSSGPPPGWALLVAVPGGVWASPDSVIPADGVRHHVALTWDLVDLKLYVDGVDVPWATFSPGALGPAPGPENYLGDPDIGIGTYQTFAIFPGDLFPSEIAALYAAGAGGIGNYSTYVRGFGAIAYYLLDGVGGGTGRTPGLAVTDGSHEVVLIGDDFAAQATPGPYGYSWQPKQQTDARSADGILTTVGIPRLILPGGYTIGTRTPDIAPTDQWTDIVVWYDDTTQEAMAGAGSYDYGRGVHLKYRQIGTP